MNAVPQNTLPLATTSALTPSRPASAGSAAGWRKTLEDAGLAGRQEGAAQTEQRAPHGVSGSVLHARAGARTAAVLAMHARGTLPAFSQYGEAGAAPQVPPAVPQGAPNTAPRECDRPQPPERTAPPVTPRRLVQPASIHVHVEHHADGIAVWLGVPAAANAISATAMVAALREAAPPGLKLARLTCNGRSVYERPEPFQESP
ncbi:hypothetical protein H8N03_19305 [Ramlibacter sp. USB13]|uniref:Uncharacterized protein n=1 Tax=Ramlibacter cellulosilyticus TaxID=2764187 RepID=A0A923MUR7_9BURK|nr:hypothetical protein [Ramlibacter cellulosilyticus]MBC5785103.1 hypothetical protein [Ramlibacter cellulosilyticus]